MAKLKTAYFCQNCGSQYSQWLGQCKNCGEWNTLVEEIVEKAPQKSLSSTKTKQSVINIIEVEAIEEPRIKTPSDVISDMADNLPFRSFNSCVMVSVV